MQNFKKVKQVLWVILFANLGVASIKIIVGNLIRSTSMVADGFHSLTDGTSNVIGLIGLHFAAQPVDDDHPYGHKKFETLSGLFIAGMLLFISGKIIIDGISRFNNPVVPMISLESLIALLVTLGVNIFVSTYELLQGKKLHSNILISDSMHTRSDIFVSIGVLITLVGVKLGLPPIIDPIASLVVSLFILHASYEIFQDTLGILTDKAVLEEERVRKLVMGFDQVKDVHKIRSRGRLDDIHIDLHIMTLPGMSVEEAHQLAHDMEEKAQEEFHKSIQMIVHVEPYYEYANELDGIDK